VNAPALRGSWQRRSDVAWRSSLDALILLPASHPEPITLTGSAVAVWNHLESAVTTAQLAAALATELQADPSEVERDLEPLLAELVDLGAIERA
jgi:Coenzyme PQQ synthesis protein D (PqqD)